MARVGESVMWIFALMAGGGSRTVRAHQVSCCILNYSYFIYAIITAIKIYISLFFLDENLCSHVWSICYLAESLFNGSSYEAEPCTRKCPAGPVIGLRRGRDDNRYAVGNLIPMGHRTPN